MRSAVMVGLTGLRNRLARRGDASAQTGFGGSVAPASDAQGQIFVLLEMEMLDGEARIVDAQTHGPSNDSFVACAQRTLRGEVIPVRDGRPGSRMRLALPLGSRRDHGTGADADASSGMDGASGLEGAPGPISDSESGEARRWVVSPADTTGIQPGHLYTNSQWIGWRTRRAPAVKLDCV